MRAVLPFLVLLVTAAGCSRAPATGLAADLPGSTWTLERVVLADGSVLRDAGNEVTFGPDGDLTLSSCNTCTGRFRLRGDELRIEEVLACTERGCPAGAVELERYLAGRHALRMDGQYLVAEPLEEAAEAEQILLLPAG